MKIGFWKFATHSGPESGTHSPVGDESRRLQGARRQSDTDESRNPHFFLATRQATGQNFKAKIVLSLGGQIRFHERETLSAFKFTLITKKNNGIRIRIRNLLAHLCLPNWAPSSLHILFFIAVGRDPTVGWCIPLSFADGALHVWRNRPRGQLQRWWGQQPGDE